MQRLFKSKLKCQNHRGITSICFKNANALFETYYFLLTNKNILLLRKYPGYKGDEGSIGDRGKVGKEGKFR